MKLFISYIKSRMEAAIVFLVCCAIFTLCFLLFRLPLRAVLYPSVLCAVIIAGFIIYDYGKMLKKYRLFQEIIKLSDSLDAFSELQDRFSEAGEAARDPAEVSCMKMISVLCESHRKYENEMNMRFTDMTEYYTLWAHQIKTPIAAARLYLQNEDSELSRKLLSELLRIENYAEMVLVFMRLEPGSTDYVIKEYELDSIIRQAVKKFSGEFILRKIKLVYEPACARVVTDEKWLSFVIEQVLSNALKYTAEGFVTLRLEEPLTLVIEDTGIGIAGEDIPRIFDKGYTGYNGRSDKRASGIGLYLCRRVCKNIGASISVSSEIGKGTAVKIDLSQRRFRHE